MSDERNSDGTLLFVADLDRENEDEAAAALGSAWKCELRKWPKLFPIDFYAVRDGRMVANVELKSRTFDSTKHADVFMAYRKWDVLMRSVTLAGCPGYFVVKFTDCMKYVNVAHVDPRKMTLGGRAQPRCATDIEPMILVPVADMVTVREKVTPS